VKDVQIVKGITDFDAVFESTIPKDLQGHNIKQYPFQLNYNTILMYNIVYFLIYE